MKHLSMAALLAAVMLLVGAVGSASAQAPTKFGEPVPMTGKDRKGKSFKGTYVIERFVRKGSRMYAEGTLTGKLKNRKVTRRDVRIPASIAAGAPATAGASQVTPPIPPTPNACQVLSLVLGPLDLNLLGLRVRLNQVRLLIEAVPSGGNTGGQAGGLLGDLLCGITNLLAPSANTPLAQLTQLLNALLALSTPAPTAGAASAAAG